MPSSYKKLSLSLQFNIFVITSILMLAGISGTISVQNASKALLESELNALHKTVKTAAELLSAPYKSLLPIVKSMALNLQKDFSGSFVVDSTQLVSVGKNNVPVMRLDGQVITNNFAKVDAFTDKWGAPATIFQRVEDDFLRVSTSLKTDTGARAFGTWLGKNHPGYKTLMDGKPYIGYAKLFGKHFITEYDPVIQDGDVVAILFVGVDVSGSVNSAFESLRNIKIGRSGYIFIADAKGRVVSHPSIESGMDVREIKAPDGSKPLQEMVEQKSGTLTYPWLNKEKETEEKYSAFAFSQDWQWIISGGTFKDEFTQAANEIALNLIVIYLAGAGIVLFAGYSIAKSMLHPLKDLANKIAIIGQGELASHNLRPPVADSLNEVDRIENSMNEMVGSFRSMINEVLETEVSIRAISNDISGNADDQLQCSDHMSQEAEMGAASVEELSASFREVAQNTNNAARSVKEVDTSAKETSGHMTVLVNSTESMTTRIGEVENSVAELSDNVHDIKRAVDLITGIADQTNLLALNAAIEAARAGEHGRGFAVVADEVRKLAQDTQGSTDEIQHVVASFLDATDNAKKNMRLTLEETRHTRDKAIESSDLLTNVSSMVGRMNMELESIAATVTEQSTISDDIANRQVDVTNIAKRSNEKAKQSISASKHLNQLSEQLASSLSKFST